jgi:hypothetical protein
MLGNKPFRRAVVFAGSLVVLAPFALLIGAGPANATADATSYTGDGVTCGGAAAIYQNAYGYAIGSIITPGFGYGTCYATDARVFWWNGSAEVSAYSGQQGSQATAVATSQGQPEAVDYHMCPGIFNCSGDYEILFEEF